MGIITMCHSIPQPKFYWGPKKRWSKLSKRWNLPSKNRYRIWSSCDSTPVCPGPVGPPGPPGIFVAATPKPLTLSTPKIGAPGLRGPVG